jgi:exopolysaccharide biosynthesis polyprenyl glycosylphosphotransferase
MTSTSTPRPDTPAPSSPADPTVAGTAAPTRSPAARRIDRRGRIGQVVQLLADAAALAVVVAVTGLGDDHRFGVAAAAIGVLAWLALLHLYGRYPRVPATISDHVLDSLPQVFHASLGGTLITAGLLAIGPAQSTFTGLLVLLVGGLVALTVSRVLVRALLRTWLGPTRTLVVGTGPNASATVAYLEAHPGIELTGRVEVVADEQPGDRADASGAPTRFSRDALSALLVREQIERVVLVTRGDSGADLIEETHLIRASGVSLTVVPDHVGVFGPGASLDQLQTVTAVSLQPPALSRTAQTLKRLLDLTASTVGLVLLAPVLVAVAVAVRLDSRGPVLFRQTRVGRHGKPFRVLKFRTMVTNADELTAELMAQSKDPNWLHLDHDPRITRIGSFLRRTSLDELPQLWNVVRGDMSLVGPRPLSVRDSDRVDGWGRHRVDLTPGITGLWQVLGRTSIPFEDMVKLDYLYVSNWSLWGDIKLLLQTLPAVLAQRGVN